MLSPEYTAPSKRASKERALFNSTRKTPLQPTGTTSVLLFLSVKQEQMGTDAPEATFDLLL